MKYNAPFRPHPAWLISASKLNYLPNILRPKYFWPLASNKYDLLPTLLPVTYPIVNASELVVTPYVLLHWSVDTPYIVHRLQQFYGVLHTCLQDFWGSDAAWIQCQLLSKVIFALMTVPSISTGKDKGLFGIILPIFKAKWGLMQRNIKRIAKFVLVGFIEFLDMIYYLKSLCIYIIYYTKKDE